MSEFDAIPSATITADLGRGVVEQAVTSWSIDRTLSGGGLPGQARAASGSSVGSGSVSVESDATPWNAGAIKPAGRVTVSASEDVGTAASRVGTMVVRSVGAPSALSSQRDLSIEDDLGGLRGPVTIPATLVKQRRPGGERVNSEAASVLDAAARAGGFYSTPSPAPSTVVSLPLTGSYAPEVGNVSYVGWTTNNLRSWGTFDGQIGLCRQSGATSIGPTPIAQWPDVPLTQTVYVTFSRAGTGMSFIVARPGLAVEAWGSNFGTYANPATGDSNTGYYTRTLPVDAWSRVQVQAEWLGVNGSTATGARARVRFGPAEAWSEWSTYTWGGGAQDISTHPDLQTVRGYPSAPYPIAGEGYLSGIQWHLNPDEPGVWDEPTARISATGSDLAAVVTARTVSSWSLIQEVAAATLGAVWIDEDGTLVYRNREQLRGSGTPSETVYSLDKLDDVPWEVSTDDVADRVEVTYNPPVVTTVSDASITVWQSTEVVAIRAGRTVTIEQDIDGVADSLAEWVPIWNTVYAPANRYSRWAASTLPGGGGPQPADDALQITAEMVNPSKVRIRIRNTTTGTLYTAGTDGTTLLTLRANVVARPSEPLTLSTGLPADKAIAPLSIDLGSWVQDQDTAQEILSWLTGTLSEPLPILRQVGVTPKASRRLGDVIVIRDPYTELASKALITGIHSSGEAGRYSQSLDLAILAAIEADVARRWLQVTDTEGDLAQYIFAQLGATATEADVARWIQTEAIA